MADAKKLAAVALTDHDTLDGLDAAAGAAKAFPSLRFLRGLEISARSQAGTLHILGYGFGPEATAIVKIAEHLRACRNDRNPRIIRKLQDLGVAITMDDVLAAVPKARAKKTDQVISRVHIAEALRRKKVVATAKEAFNRFLGDGKPAFVDKERMDPHQSIRSIVDSGGMAVLAHPAQLLCDNRAQLERLLRSLMRDGLGGIEVYHTDHSPEQTRQYLDLARKYKLEVTGGSDYHGGAKQDAKLGYPRTPVAALTGRMLEMVTGR